MLKHAQGNLIDLAEAGKFDVIIHGCNCFNTMGGGIAREIAQRYPEAAKADRSTVSGNIDKLGSYTVWETGSFCIVNAYTQYNMSTGEDVFEYEAFGVLIRKFVHIFAGCNIGIPYIGMGLAKGDKELIMSYIEHFADEMIKTGGSLTLVEFK
jgi:O-acetyl-ADP-ribose deacetylase (regulator of RNase III)